MKITPISINMNLVLTGQSKNRPWLNIAAGILFSLLASFSLFQYASAEVLTNGIIAKGKNIAAAKGVDVLDAELTTALAMDPLNQNLVNAGLLLKSNELSSDERARWIAIIGKMGWRSTAALQTLITDAARNQDLSNAIIVADALLRRNQLFEEAVNLMNLLEAEPSTWEGVYNRLRKPVPWRIDYLLTAASISQPAIIDGRIRTLQRLQATGDRFSRSELAPSIEALMRAGKLAEAYEIWRVHAKQLPAPLNDTDFSIAVGAGSNNDVIFPFEWQFFSGTGFSAYPSEDGLNGATVVIQWDGRGVPLFMSQLTAATPGNYRFAFKVDGDAQKFASRVAVRFRCGNEVIRTRNSVKPNSQIVAAETLVPIPCAFPWIDIFGQIQDRSAAVELALNRVMLERIAN